MACKFYAAMTVHRFLALLLWAAVLAPVWAESADRGKPLTIEADQPGTVDLLKRLVVFNGNVVVAQGTMTIFADRVEVHERSDGYRSAIALGRAAKPASFRQKREGLDETIEGHAENIEYDSGSGVVRLAGRAELRRLRGATTADEVSGGVITYESRSEIIRVQGAPAAAAGSAPAAAGGGRVRVVITPRPDAPTASAPRQ
jgi:lipopolysaccharide export system protein LptA